MTFTRIFAEMTVADLDAASAWYELLLGRGPDDRPMDGLLEWQVTGSGWLQVFVDPERAGRSTMTLGVADLDEFADALAARGLELTSRMATSRGQRLGSLADPAGNLVTVAEELPPVSSTP